MSKYTDIKVMEYVRDVFKERLISNSCNDIEDEDLNEIGYENENEVYDTFELIIKKMYEV
jgi:hypothetical protein